MPGMSFSSCSDSSDTARSMLAGSSGTWPGVATMPVSPPRKAASASTLTASSDLAGGEHRVARGRCHAKQRRSPARNAVRQSPAARRDPRRRAPSGSRRPATACADCAALARQPGAPVSMICCGSCVKCGSGWFTGAARKKSAAAARLLLFYCFHRKGLRGRCRQWEAWHAKRWRCRRGCFSRRSAPAAAGRSRSPARSAARAGRSCASSKSPGAR